MLNKKTTPRKPLATLAIVCLCGLLMSSSHREAPLIANDPLADNTDLYVFKNPNAKDKMVIIANYIPAELPYGAGCPSPDCESRR